MLEDHDAARPEPEREAASARLVPMIVARAPLQVGRADWAAEEAELKVLTADVAPRTRRSQAACSSNDGGCRQGADRAIVAAALADLTE